MLIGGEFHYFRAKRREWEDRIKKIKAAGFNMVSTYIPWIVHERNEGVFDFKNGEKDLYYFLELVKAYGLFCLVRP
ncbi:MAG: beta-galactosidase, partial [Petrotogaceae bacterium]|nr:beta-galactosidase [Petrotogaceae bacterium]